MPYSSKYSKKLKKPKGKLEYKKFRVRGHIRSFRDLEIYKQTTYLSSRIYEIKFLPKLEGKKLLEGELGFLRTICKQVPRLIAESYGDRFTDQGVAYAKLEEAMRYVRQVITKLDFLIAVVDHRETKEMIVKLIGKYQRQRRKILNLKRAWVRIEEKREKRVSSS